MSESIILELYEIERSLAEYPTISLDRRASAMLLTRLARKVLNRDSITAFEATRLRNHLLGYMLEDSSITRSDFARIITSTKDLALIPDADIYSNYLKNVEKSVNTRSKTRMSNEISKMSAHISLNKDNIYYTEVELQLIPEIESVEMDKTRNTIKFTCKK